MFCEIKSKPSDENSQAKDLFLIKLFWLLCLLLLFEHKICVFMYIVNICD